MTNAMANDFTADRGRFRAHIEASRRQDDLFEDLYQEATPEEQTVAGLRRRRRRATNDIDSVIKTVSLVEEDGTLYWRDGVPGRRLARRRGRRRALDATTEGSLVMTKPFRTLAPNKIVAAMGRIDRRLNDAVDETLCSRLRQLRRTPAGAFEFQKADAHGPFHGRTLLFVHGTFVNASSMLEEFTDPSGPA